MSAAPNDLPKLSTLHPCIDRFGSLHIVVWGDIVADRFLYGSTTRVSREAPALVLRHESEEIRPGGAGNAMMNAAALGAAVSAVGYLGDDDAGNALRAVLEGAGLDTALLTRRGDGPTPVKTRVMAGGLHTVRQQVLRIDQDRSWPPRDKAGTELAESLQSALDGADALLISDYGLGSVDQRRYVEIRDIISERDLPVFLDSRAALLEFSGVSAATPNENEVEEALGIRLDGSLDTLESAGSQLLEQLGGEALLITRGSMGIAVFERDRPVVHLPIYGTDQIADVTGAGDSVIATFALSRIAGASTIEAACLANVAGGLSVMKRGTATISHDELIEVIEDVG